MSARRACKSNERRKQPWKESTNTCICILTNTPTYTAMNTHTGIWYTPTNTHTLTAMNMFTNTSMSIHTPVINMSMTMSILMSMAPMIMST